MADIQKLIDTIISDPKLSGEKVYTDVPILRTAAQMANYTPPKYREMKKLARSFDSYRQSEVWLFCEQGKFMADFEDSYDYRGDFVRYFPTYRSMNDFQLRGYFSWRTKVRHGTVEKTSLSFVFVYIYELLNLIGVADAAEGFNTLRAFWSSYREYDRSIDRYIKQWLADFVVYYNLDSSLLDGFADTQSDRFLTVLRDRASYSDDELFEALVALSSYNLENSRFAREYPEDVKAVACGVYTRLEEYYGKNRKYGIFEKLFGRIYCGPYHMFGSAIFYDTRRYKNYEYTVSDICKYTCRNGAWQCEKYYGAKGKNRSLGAILKTVDCVMREQYGYTPLLKPEKATKILLSIIGKEIDAYLQAKRANAARIIEIDVSKLGDIRRSSLETQSKLIVDEEPEVPEAPEPVGSDNEAGLSADEYTLLHCLLWGGDYTEKLKGAMLSVISDSVNEKLFDLLGDTAIVFDGDSPALLDDYIDELKGIIEQ